MAAVLLSGAVCAAQPQAGGAGPSQRGDEPAPTAASPWQFGLELSGRYEFQSRLRNNTGNSEVGRIGGEVSIGYAASEHLILSLDIGLEESFYQFKGTTLVPGTGDPMGATTRLEIDPTMVYLFDEHWGMVAGAVIGLAFENGADIGQSFTAGGLLAARYRFSDSFALTLGGAVRTRLEDSVQFVPVIGVQWQITPEVRLSTRGLGVELKAKVAESWSVLVFGLYETREFRLDDTGPLPNGAGRDTRLPIGVGIIYSPTKNIDVRLEGGAIVWQEYLFENSAGVRVGRQQSKISPMIGLHGTIRF